MISPFLVQAMGWALLHFIWQGALIAFALVVALRCLRSRSANARYLVSCAALLLMLAAPISTLCHLMNASTSLITEDGSLKLSLATDERAGAGALLLVEQPLLRSGFASGELLNQSDGYFRHWLEAHLNRVVPYLLIVWLTGVLILFVRFIGGWIWAQRLKRKIDPTLAGWQATLDSLLGKIRVSRPVRLCESALVEAPTVIGWLHPLIIFPAKSLTGLEPQQLRALLAHELAHIRRYDYLINMLQTIIEILLFYHPAVWWVAKQMRVEREHACDDMAVALCDGDAIVYARALLSVEEMRAGLRAPALVMTADGGSLLSRIRRIVAPRPNHTSSSSIAAVLSLALLIGAAANLLLLKGAKAQAAATASAAMTKAAQGQMSAPKTYQAMTRGEQTAYIAEQSRRIARQMSGTEYEFTPAFEAEIQKSVDYYARRIGNNQGDRLGTGDARFVFERGQTYAPTLIGVFRARNVSPLIGLYLPLIESEYVNIQTPNELGAMGMFQFLPQTGKRYGLAAEELTDVEKSADAAARYIADSLNQFRNDPMKEALALLSYNRGRQKLASDLQLVIDEQNRRCSICALTAARLRLDETFQKENVYYVPRFFAAAIIGENPQAFGLALPPLSSFEIKR